MRCTHRVVALLAACFLLTSSSIVRAQEKPQAPGLGDPGNLQSISIETGRLDDGVLTIAGRDAGQQLIVLGHYDSGQVRDLTRDVSYTTSPNNIAKVDANGYTDHVKMALVK